MNYSIWGFFSHYYQSVPIFHNPAEAIKTTFSNEFLTQSRVNLHNFFNISVNSVVTPFRRDNSALNKWKPLDSNSFEAFKLKGAFGLW